MAAAWQDWMERYDHSAMVFPGDLLVGEASTTFAIFISPFLPRGVPNRGRLGGDMEGRVSSGKKVMMAVLARVPNGECTMNSDRYPRQELYVRVLQGLDDGCSWGWIPLDHIRELGLQKVQL